jgi:diaminohydroxyphosphoribosylaminopyrimidine deaminase/5-amino-6-(5-phosphoribosylamino)uracil reductase
MQVQSVMIEGGSKLLQSFIYEGLWEEARIIKNSGMIIKEGLDAPVLNGGILVEVQRIKDDTVSFIKKNAPDD